MGLNQYYNDKEWDNDKKSYSYTPIFRDSLKKMNIEKGNRKKYRNFAIILTILTTVFFCLNVFLSCLLYYNVKYVSRKNLNINYYNVNDYTETQTTYAVQSAYQSSVCISAGGTVRDEETFYSNSASRGSGVIYKIDNENNCIYILTCYHVFCGYENAIYVLFAYSYKPVKATVVGYSEKYDIAVIKTNITDYSQSCSDIVVKNSQFLSLGESVFAIGNSLSGGISVTSGVISKLNKEISVDGVSSREIQTDTAINPGNSGGGLFNSLGEFIGLVNAKYCTTTSDGEVINIEGMSFAIPSTLVISIAKSIIYNSGFPRFIDLGVTFYNLGNTSFVTVIDGAIVEEFEVRVESVDTNSISDGNLQEEDIILSFKYTDLDGNSQEVDMLNKYCFEDVCFDILKNSDIEFKIIRPLLNEELTIIINANSETVQN